MGDLKSHKFQRNKEVDYEAIKAGISEKVQVLDST